MKITRRTAIIHGAIIGLALAGCSSDEPLITSDQGDLPIAEAALQDTAATDQPAASTAADEEGRQTDFVGSLSLEPTSGPAGTVVTVTGIDLPADADLSLLWSTADCGWLLEGDLGEEYKGRACTPVEQPLDEVATDADGLMTATFTVPDDYGFAHDVLLIDRDGVIRNRALFSISMDVEVTPTSGPVGTPITIEVRGMGYQSLEDTRTILYDDRYVGFMSAVTTRGTARAVIPATGSVGSHLIEIERGAYTFPYMNPEQSPRPDILTYDAVFTITDGDPVLPPGIDDQAPAPVAAERPDDTAGPLLSASLTAGPTGSPLTLLGSGFDPGAEVTFDWFRIVGNRVGGQGWEERALPFGEATVGSDGTFTVASEIPEDVGGPHRIEAVVEDEVVALTSVSITPRADPVAERVSWGDDLAIHLTGVGWTETANIYTVVYDNAYVGYACGFNTQGDVLIHLKATGDEGWHFVDLYPAIYKGDELPGRNNFRIPQLTAVDDHPGEDLPIFRYAFYLER